MKIGDTVFWYDALRWMAQCEGYAKELQNGRVFRVRKNNPERFENNQWVPVCPDNKTHLVIDTNTKYQLVKNPLAGPYKFMDALQSLQTGGCARCASHEVHKDENRVWFDPSEIPISYILNGDWTLEDADVELD